MSRDVYNSMPVFVRVAAKTWKLLDDMHHVQRKSKSVIVEELIEKSRKKFEESVDKK